MMKELSDNYVYILYGQAYINLTNRCHNDCAFCIRHTGNGVAGTPLWLDREPTAAEVMRAFDALKSKIESDEVVFCGYGEPTEALDTLIDCAKQFKARGYRLRLNTNGLGSRTNGANIAPELKDFDKISVSLNECTPEKYAAITRSAYGAEALPAILDFAAECVKAGIDTVFTVVDVIGDAEIEKCRALCDKLGIPLRVRGYISDNYGEKGDDNA